MADNNQKSNLPTPQQAQADLQNRLAANFGFEEVLRAIQMGMAPTAPRLPSQGNMTSQYFGGYPKGFGSRIGTKGSLSFEHLRSLAEKSSVLTAIISKRQHQFKRFSRLAYSSKKGEVGFRVKHKRSNDTKFKVPEGFEELCRESEQMLLRPWNVYWDEGRVFREVEPTFDSFLSKICEDLLVINRPVVELGLDFFKMPRAFGAIDGANVIPTFSALKYLTAINAKDVPKGWDRHYANYRSTLQFLSDKYRVDLDDSTEYIYILEGRPVAGFRSDQLLITPMFPSSDVRKAGYPRSLTERAIFMTCAEIMAMTANSRYFEYGSMSEVIIAMKGNQKDQHVAELAQIFQANASGVGGMHRVPLIATPGGKDDIDVINLKQNHKDMLFDIYIQKLTNLICAVFSMHPSEINEAPRAGDNSGGLQQASQVKQINMAQEQGLEANLLHVKTHIFDPILERIDPDLCFEWEYGNNEMEQLDVTTKYGSITTVNERRQMMGLDPLPEEKGGEVIDNQFVQAMLQREQEAQAQQQQAAMGGDEGQPPGPGEEDEVPPGQGPGDDEEEEDDEQEAPEEESDEDRIKRIASMSGRKKKA